MDAIYFGFPDGTFPPAALIFEGPKNFHVFGHNYKSFVWFGESREGTIEGVLSIVRSACHNAKQVAVRKGIDPLEGSDGRWHASCRLAIFNGD